jgi:SWI/SNF-related matrix-associated actin-dependent regulator 1 of chromatin subfamily A
MQQIRRTASGAAASTSGRPVVLRHHPAGPTYHRHFTGGSAAAGPLRPERRPHISPAASSDAAAGASPPPPVFVFTLGAAVELSAVSTHAAHAAASRVWGPEAVPGAPAVFQRTMAALLECACQPHDAALLLRVAADEGIVGARSRSGCEGPVVGRQLHARGTRPLLVSEVLEDFDSVRVCALVRWAAATAGSGGGGGGELAAALDERVRAAYAAAEEEAAAALEEGALAAAAHASVARALRASQRPVLVASAHAPALGRALLERSGLAGAATLVQGGSWREAVAAAAEQARRSSCGGTVHIVAGASAGEREALEAGAAAGASLHVGEWAAAVGGAAARARLARAAGGHLLREYELAELLGATADREMMDCVAW